MQALNAVVSGLSSQGWSIQCEADARHVVQMLLAAAGLRVWSERRDDALEVEVGRLRWLFDVKWIAKGQLAGFRQRRQTHHYNGVPAALIVQATRADLVFSENKQQFMGQIVRVSTVEKAS